MTILEEKKKIKHSTALVFLINTVFCLISMAAAAAAHYTMFAIASAAVVFLVCQGLIVFLLRNEINWLENIRQYWPVYLTGILVLFRTLITLAQCYFYQDAVQTYAKMSTLLTIMTFYGIAVFLMIIIKESHSFENMFLLQASVFGIILTMVFPVYGIADEPQHLRTAYSLSNTLMGIQSPEDGLTMRKDDAEFMMAFPDYTLDDFNQYLTDLSKPLKSAKLVTSKETDDISQSLDYARRLTVFKTEKYQYFAPALGICLGRILSLNTGLTWLLGRGFNLIFYMAVIFVSLKLLPVGKSILYTVSLLPMSLQLAGSASRDVFRICIAILTLALTLFLFYGNCESGKKKTAAVIALLISAGLLLPLRTFVYSTVAVLPVLLFLYRKKRLTNKVIAWTLFACAVLFLCAIFIKYVIFPGNIVTEPEIPMSWAPGLQYSKEYFINHPLDMLSIIRTTFWNNTNWYIETMIGSSLGWLDWAVPMLLIRVLSVVLLVSTVSRSYETVRLPAQFRAVLLGCFVLSAMLIVAGMTITWTPLGAPAAEGIQGRYFLPVILPLLLAFRGNHITADEKCDLYCMCIQFAALIYTVEFMLLRLM